MKKPVDAETPQPEVQLAKWTDDVRDGMQPRIRPAAPALPVLNDGQKLATKAGQRRLVQLADGTRLYVNEKTEVEVVAARHISLHAGQIYLEVAPQDKASSFVVKTTNRELTATGTHFAVAADPNAAGLVVTQGKVAVKGIEKEVAAGQQVAAGESAISSAVRASHTLAWTRDLMAAAETPMVPACQHGGGELIALDPQGQEIKLSLRQYHIDVHIEDGFARTTIDQTYFNTTWERLEGTFYFPLPADASLSRLAMYVVDANNQCKLMEGGMAERKHAADVYETIRYMRRDPALLEWLDGSTFKMRVFPLEAKQEKRIILSYTQKLPSLYGAARYRFTGGLNMPVVHEWSFNCRIKSGAGMTVWSPTLPDAMILPQGGDTLVRHFANNVKPAADVTIEMQDKTAVLENDVPRFAAMLADNQQYLMLRYRPTLPSLPERQRRDWIILFEASAQRDPVVAGTQLDILRNLLKNAEYDDTFVLMTANSKVQVYDGEPSPVRGRLRDADVTDALRGSARRATPQNVAEAIKFLQSAHLVGALDLEKALQAALKFAKDAKNPHLLHIGSGIPAMGQRDAGKLAQMLPERVPYVGVGVGKRWNRAFMKAAAERTNGLFTQINPDEVVAWRAFELLATLNTPRLLDVQVIDAAGQPEPRFLSETTMIAQGEEICAMTRVGTNKGALPGKVVVKGTLDGKPFVKEFPVANVLSGAGYLPRIWAKLEIDRLLAADSARHKDEIIALSKAMYVMTPYTSLLVLETDADYERFKVDRGRKDHWAMYQCPPKIPLVYEPEGKAPVKEEKPEVRKDRKPTMEEVARTMAIGNSSLAVFSPQSTSLNAQTDAIRVLALNPAIAGVAADKDAWLDRAAWSERMVKRGFYSVKQAEADRARLGLESLGETKEEWRRFWMNDQPSHLTPYRIHGGVGPAPSSIGDDAPDGGGPPTYVPPLATWKALMKTRKDKYEVADANDVNENSIEFYPPALALIVRGKSRMHTSITGGVIKDLDEPLKLPELESAERRSRALRSSINGATSAEDLREALLDMRVVDITRRIEKGASKDQAESTQKLQEAAKRFDRGVHANEEVFIELLKDNKMPPPAVRGFLDFDGSVTGREQFGAEIGLQGPMFFARAATPVAPASLRYERPQFDYDRTLFTDLLQYAPGLSTAWADVLGALEEEADVAAPKLGSIDPAARKLIDKARAADWQTLTIPAHGPIPGYKIHFNGIGQFTYERILGSGLGEQVICDGKTLWFTCTPKSAWPANAASAGIITTWPHRSIPRSCRLPTNWRVAAISRRSMRTPLRLCRSGSACWRRTTFTRASI